MAIRVRSAAMSRKKPIPFTMKTIDELRAVGGDAWDDIDDVAAYLNGDDPNDIRLKGLHKNEANGNRNTAADANMEQDLGNAALRTNEAKAFSTPCRITFHHVRKRLADIDGISGKAVIDGLVQAGVLADDTAKQVTEVRNCQTKGETEETRIVIESDE